MMNPLRITLLNPNPAIEEEVGEPSPLETGNPIGLLLLFTYVI